MSAFQRLLPWRALWHPERPIPLENAAVEANEEILWSGAMEPRHARTRLLLGPLMAFLLVLFTLLTTPGYWISYVLAVGLAVAFPTYVATQWVETDVVVTATRVHYENRAARVRLTIPFARVLSYKHTQSPLERRFQAASLELVWGTTEGAQTHTLRHLPLSVAQNLADAAKALLEADEAPSATESYTEG